MTTQLKTKYSLKIIILNPEGRDSKTQYHEEQHQTRLCQLKIELDQSRK